MNQKHTDQISPKMQTDIKISRKETWQKMCFTSHQTQTT